MDNLFLVLFFSFIAINITLIIITLISLLQLGDERKKLIKMKAQSFTFSVVIGYILIEIVEKIYKAFWGNSSYEGMNPFSVLTTFSILYLISLLFFKKRYGD